MPLPATSSIDDQDLLRSARLALAGEDAQSAKRMRHEAADGTMRLSYAQVADVAAPLARRIEAWRPDLLLVVSGCAIIPAQMLRAELRRSVPMFAVSLEDGPAARSREANMEVLKKQWYDEATGSGWLVPGLRVLIVDLVDTTRTTLEFCVQALLETNGPSAIGVAVLHNKVRPKRGRIPDGVAYFAGEDVADMWIRYPWDAMAEALSPMEHEEALQRCSVSVSSPMSAQGHAAAAA